MHFTPVPRRRRTAAKVASAVAAALIATTLQVLPHATTTASADTGPAVRSLEKPVKVSAAKVKPRPVDRTVSHPSTPKSAWPAAGTATVSLATPFTSLLAKPGNAGSAGDGVKAGTLPVTLRPATTAGKDRPSASPTAPAKATVRILDHAAAVKAGVDGVLMTVSRSGTTAGRAQVSLDYSAFAGAAGGGYGERLRLVQLPACSLTTPEVAKCRVTTPLAGTNDSERQTVTADDVTVPAEAKPSSDSPLAAPRTSPDPGVTVLAATTDASGPSGDYKATPLASASTWSTGLNSGSFSWNYSMPVPSVPGGLMPKVGLSYSSGSIDGRTANTNNQGSWAGDGFDMDPGFVERSYKLCGDDGVKTDGVEPGDLCWGYDNATISFSGHSGQLIPVSADEWRISGDDGTKVLRLRDTAHGNGDNDGEYFEAITTNGTRYYFGYNRLPNWTSGKPETKSVETVPVYGDDGNEPCHASTFADSWCQQGWRWNLDLVIDTNGDDVTYWYKPETNSYGRNLKSTDDTPYVRAATLGHIEYGQQQTDIYSTTVKPMARVDFGTAERCLETTAALCDPASIDTNRQYWYDTPWDMNCEAGTTCDAGRYSPTFFTRTRLTDVTTSTLQSDGTYTPIDTWVLHHKWGTADTDYQLLLDSITHTALAGTTPITPPATTLQYDPRIGRLDRTGDGRSPFYKQRLSTIDDEVGGQVDVNYSQAACDWDSLPTPQTNTTHCFPQAYQPSSDVPVTTEWFNKYVVDSVISTDRTGGAPDMVTRYFYLDDGAWAFADDEGITKEKLKTWSEWRGHAHVRVETGGTSGMSTQTDHYFLRGMDGDRSDPADATATRTVTVQDPDLGTLTDDQAWAGFEYRTESYDAPNGKILAKTASLPWKKQTAKRVRDWGTTTANLTGTSVSHSYTSLDNGAGSQWSETRSTTSFDDYGRATQVESLGDVALPGDDTCTRTTYADNTADWILTAAIHAETVAGTCAAQPNRDTQPDGTSAVLADKRVRFDGQAYGKAPTRGLATLTETLKSRNGTTATYIDDAATYDLYGRQLTATVGASTSVFDPTDDTEAPVTTPASAARTTTSVYTPATGRLTKTVVTTPPSTVGVDSTKQTTTTYTDALRGLPVISLDTNAKRTDVLYDALGRALKVWQPNRSKASGQTPNTEYVYTNADNVIASIKTKTLNNDGSQDSAYTLYDGFGRPRQTQSPAQDGGRLLTDTFYDERGQAALAYAPYYANGAPGATLLKVEDATGVETQTATTFDGLGRTVRTQVLAGNGAGTPLATTLTSYSGNTTSVTPPKGGTPTTTITDATGHITELRQYDSATPTGTYDATTYAYDPRGDLIKLTDPSANVWTWTYDQLGRQVKAVDPDTGTNTKAYNDRGELVSTTDGRGKTVTHIYDNLSREIETHDGAATGPLLTSQTWDPTNNKGQLASTTRYATVSGTTYQYKTVVNTYDALYRVTKSTLTVPSVPGQEGLAGDYVGGSQYNLDGTLQGTAYPAAGNLPAEGVAYTYDSLHRPATIGSNLSTYLTGQTYSLTNKPTQSTLNAGSKSTWVTNSYEWGTQRLAGSRTDQQDITGAARATAYTYDEAGNVTSLLDNSRTGTDQQCFQYDHLGRLTEAFTPAAATCPTTPAGTTLGGPAPYWTSYTYNTDGTRDTETRHDPTGITAADSTSTYTYHVAGAGPHTLADLTTTTGTATPVHQTYGYDTAGNTTTRHLAPTPGQTDDQTLTWGTEDHLDHAADSVTTTAGTGTTTTAKTTDYIYDTAGNRLIEHTLDTANPSAENTTLYLGTTEINFVKGAAKATATRYYPLGSATAVRTDDRKVTFQITDAHGTADAGIDAATGELNQHYETPFGQDRGPAPATWAGTRGFLGGTKDTATGLTHLGARDYDPTTGRFLSVDPLLASTDPQSLAGYTYSNNNPLTYSDPTGQQRSSRDGGDAPCSEQPGAGQYACPDNPDPSGDNISVGDLVEQEKFGTDVNNDHLATIYPGYSIPIDWDKAQAYAKAFNATMTRLCKPYNWDCDAFSDYNLYGVERSTCNEIGGCPAGIEASLAQQIAAGFLEFGFGGNDGAGRTQWGKVKPKGSKSVFCSFSPDTPVLLGDGQTEEIGKLEPGQQVESADPETGRHKGPRTITATLVHHDDDLVDLTIESTPGHTSTLHTTANHPFWDDTLHKWITAGHLTPGHALETATDQHATITAVSTIAGDADMYNLTVDQLHTYYVLAGDTPVLVHNSGCFNPAEMGAALPEYAGGTTSGTGVAANGRVYNIESGNKAADADLLKIVNDRLRAAGRIPGTVTSARASDAEQKFAATMIRDGIDNADLVINNPAGPCTVRLGCDDALGTILGDRQLTVHWPDGSGGWTSQTYGGAG
ncbi:RHS repeat-associated core domain-containing protein [Actinacidiphila epipremni]|uniref:Sugar-binding protein n=1 Tax=Actinacidiphila epipremni TaxID=2053013 RepID=A0ABX0ZFH5_9ACTN|nr:RHS repeat-associated core domain-containing protein [Actinacidiphila epipremni]NJP42545.1 sugar-binding protein [Actinacidiphila epipremni]